MSMKISFYDLIKNNEEALLNEPDCFQLRLALSSNSKLKGMHGICTSVDQSTIKHYNDIIFCVKVNINVVEGRTWPDTNFVMEYIPFVHRETRRKYYILIKDMEAFKNTNLSKFTLTLQNYKNIFTIATCTANHPTVSDIIVNRLMIYLKIQNDEVAKIVINMATNLAIFTGEIGTRERPFLDSYTLDNYRNATSILIKQIAGNNKLKYGVDYELSAEEALKLLNKRVNFVLFPAEKVYPIARGIREEEVIDCITDPPFKELDFPNSVPGYQWVTFFEGTEFSQKREANEDKKQENSMVYMGLPECVQNHPIFKKPYRTPQRARVIKKQYNPCGDVYSVYRSTDIKSVQKNEHIDLESPEEFPELPQEKKNIIGSLLNYEERKNNLFFDGMIAENEMLIPINLAEEKSNPSWGNRTRIGLPECEPCIPVDIDPVKKIVQDEQVIILGLDEGKTSDDSDNEPKIVEIFDEERGETVGKVVSEVVEEMIGFVGKNETTQKKISSKNVRKYQPLDLDIDWDKEELPSSINWVDECEQD